MVTFSDEKDTTRHYVQTIPVYMFARNAFAVDLSENDLGGVEEDGDDTDTEDGYDEYDKDVDSDDNKHEDDDDNVHDEACDYVIRF